MVQRVEGVAVAAAVLGEGSLLRGHEGGACRVPAPVRTQAGVPGAVRGADVRLTAKHRT